MQGVLTVKPVATAGSEERSAVLQSGSLALHPIRKGQGGKAGAEVLPARQTA